MTKKRNRAKQAMSLEERLSKFTCDLRHRAEALDPGTDEARRLEKRIRQSEDASRLNVSLNAGR